jgi:crotonobetainyl-CoA:carnitine CoA-transferase CaiB-like acyl-CoA transferase
VVRPAARFSRSRHAVAGPAPRRGEHNRPVLAELAGYDDARLDRLEAAGILLAE